MQSQSFPVVSPLAEQQHQQAVESLNQLMDPISFLTETEMQQDLDFFANTQFSYDVPPASVLDDSCCWGNDCHGSSQHNVSHGNDVNPYCYDTTNSHHHSSNTNALSSPTATTLSSSGTTTGAEEEDIHPHVHSNPKHAPERHQPKLTKDDKRKRNTAASARFRVKKKMREQALQRTAFEMTEKSKRLEAHVQDLEREIKWLKALVVEKSEGRLEKLVNERPIPTAHQYTRAPYPPANSMSLPQHDLEDEQDDDYY